MVANVNNPSATATIKVAVVFVQGKGEKEERSYRLEREVKPLDSLTVGWAKLGGWKLKHGDKLRIRCDGTVPIWHVRWPIDWMPPEESRGSFTIKARRHQTRHGVDRLAQLPELPAKRVLRRRHCQVVRATSAGRHLRLFPLRRDDDIKL
jgi:hypothetical protein